MSLAKNLYRSVFFKDRWFLGMILGSLVVAGINAALLWWNFELFYIPTIELVPLHYKVVLGIDFLGPWYYPYALLGIGVIALAANYLLFRISRNKDASVRFILMASALAVQVILCAYTYLIIQINLV